jgi:glycerol kinase
VVRPVVAETTALGSAYASGLAVGFWDDVESLRQNWRADKTWEPEMEEAEREELYRGWKKAVKRTFDWIE